MVLQVLRYIEAFVKAFDLAPVVQTRTEVLAVRPLGTAAAAPGGSKSSSTTNGGGGGSGWEVTVRGPGPAAVADGSSGSSGSSSEQTSTLVYDAVVVCNGHFSEPRVPEFEGQGIFPGRQLHSHNYRVPEPFAGQRGGGTRMLGWQRLQCSSWERHWIVDARL